MSGIVRIKICGVMHPEDALEAVKAGADLIGVNFVPGSPRQVDVKQALAICEALEGLDVERVALFRDAPWDEIDAILRRVPFERVQFHGDENGGRRRSRRSADDQGDPGRRRASSAHLSGLDPAARPSASGRRSGPGLGLERGRGD